MTGLLGGKIKVSGDKTRLMALQTARLSAAHRNLLKEIDAITE